MEYSSESPSPALGSENNIRHLQWQIQSEIENVEKDVSKHTYMETCNLCDIVKDQILDYEDEPQLSKNQNNFRRIYIASELIFRICSIHDHIVDFVFTKIINDLLHLDKYKIISSKITQKASSNLKKEKFFTKEAHTKLLKSLREEERETRSTKPGFEEVETEELECSHSNIHHSTIQKEISEGDHGQILVEDTLIDSHVFNLMDDMTEGRAEPLAEASNLNFHTGPILNDVSLQPAEVSIREPFDQQQVEEDINEIILNGNKISKLSIRKSGLSEKLLESVGNIQGFEDSQIEKLPSPTKSVERPIHPEEGSEEWSLSTLEPVEMSRKKCLRLRTDKLTVIPNYSIRAVQLNKNIEIHRVQVYEGSPRILQSISSEYLMNTPGFKRFMSQNVRNSMLSRLYERNLKTEKRPIEAFVTSKIPNRIEESNITQRKPELQERPPQISQDLIEDVGEKVGMRSAPVETCVSAELVNAKMHPNISGNELLERNNLTGLPMSRIVSPIIQPPEQEKINYAAPLPSPRIQQLQGTTLEPKNYSPCFFSTKEKPPRADFRVFNYVRNKLNNYWYLFESQGMEKSITMREFLLFEEDGNFANYLTVLRIVDKLSIQRELFLDYKNGEVLIKPFETPYVSEDQLLLQAKERIM